MNTTQACIYDSKGRVIYQWPAGYNPSREEARLKVVEILRAEGRNVV